jgi:hypothetical protein
MYVKRQSPLLISDMDMKKCNVCKKTKPLTDFGKGKMYKGTQYYRALCKQCVNDRYKDKKRGELKQSYFDYVANNGGAINDVDNSVLIETVQDYKDKWLTSISVYGGDWFTVARTIDKEVARDNHYKYYKE